MHAAAVFDGYSIFLPQLNRGADHKQTNGNMERNGRDQHLLHALHTALLPSEPWQRNARGRLCQATVPYWHCVRLSFHRGAIRAHVTFAVATPSRVWV